MDRRVNYLLTTSNGFFFVKAEPDLADLKESKKFIFCSDYEHATEYDSYDYDELKEVADKYGFNICKKIVKTEINHFYTVD